MFSASANITTTSKQHVNTEERESSPSLRTYGTFGRIQSSLAVRKDILAPPVSTTSEKESDLFTNFETSHVDSHGSLPEGPQLGAPMTDAAWMVNGSPFSYQNYPGNDFGIAPGWDDGTLNFSMMPSQYDWISQSLGAEFGFGALQNPSLGLDE